MISEELDMTCLAARTTSGLVRTLVEFHLTEWGLLSLAQDAYLIAGELVANAVEQTPDQEIRVRCTREHASVLLAVWDCSDEMPIVTPVKELTLDDIEPDPQALDAGHQDGTGGWGLPIVEALSSDRGVQRTPPRGKWVWARMAVPASGGVGQGGVSNG